MSRDPRFPALRADAAALQAFVAVARVGTVGAAADLLSRTQPSVSARLAALEDSWGTRLFQRVARGMRLTPEGARLLPLAETVLRQLTELDREAGLPVSEAAELRVGAGDALGRARLPAALAKLLRSIPGLAIRLREGPGPRLLDALVAGEIDLALVVGEPPQRDGLDVEPALESPVALLVPHRDPRWSSRSVTLSRLGRERHVTLLPGSGFRRHVETAFAAAGAPFVPAVEVGNLSLVRRFVAAGLGIALVPAIAFPLAERPAGVRRLDVRAPPVVYSRAQRAGAPVPTAVAALLEELGSA